jgi:hypothetical protein
MDKLQQPPEKSMLGKVLIGLGILLLAGQILSFNWFSILWPFFIIIPGLPFLYAAANSDDEAHTGLVFPGVIITGTGLILLVQALTGHFESWAYAWSLYPVMVGLGLQFQGKHLGNREELRVGPGMVRYGLMAFAGLAFMFEFLIFGGIFGSLWCC